MLNICLGFGPLVCLCMETARYEEQVDAAMPQEGL
jgi:hypothetical protein